MNHNRKSTLVGRAFWNFLGASILTTVAGQLAVSTDAAIVSHLMGPHAMAAVNMAMPVLTVFLSLNSLLGVGASLLAAKAIGSRDKGEASRIFTAALYSVLTIGIAVSVVCSIFSGQIAKVVCSDAELLPLVHSYVKVTCLGVTVLVLSGMMNMMVQSDGRPRLVTCAVMAGAVTNVVLDIVFIKFLGWGISGSAWATVINYAVTVCITISHLRRPSCSYRILACGKWVWRSLKANLTEGTPMMIANVMLSVVVLLINRMVNGVLGSDGVYIVAVCIQLLLITFVVLNGVIDAMFAIGGALVGEKDTRGLGMLNRLVMTFAATALAAFTLFVALFPGVMATIFGADDPALRGQLCRALRIFSIILLPFSITVVMRGMFQVLGYLVLSTGIAVAQVALIVITIFLFTELAPADMLWWGFPLSAIVLLAVQMGITWRISRRQQQGTSPVTLLPPIDESHTFDATLKNADEIDQIVHSTEDFLHSVSVDATAIDQLTGQLADTLKSIGISSATDVHIVAEGNHASLTVKYGGKARENASKQAFGLNVVNCQC